MSRSRARADASDGQVEMRRLLENLPTAAYTCDADGLITYFNRRAAEVWGREPRLHDPIDRYCGSFRLFAADGRAIRRDQCSMALALREGRPHEGQELVIGREDGSRVTVLAHAHPIRDASGQILGALNILMDVTEHRLALEGSRRLAAIVQFSDDAIVSKSLDGTIRSWNPAAERMFGWRADEVIGRSIRLIIPPDRSAEEDEVLARVRRGESIEHYETVRVRKDGTFLDISLTVSPIKDPDGRIVGASKIARDITDRKRAEHALREADRQKDEFLATLGHELRNPLAPIANAVEILKLDVADRTMWERARTVIERQLHHMVRLVDDLIDISRISRNKLVLRKERIELATAVQNAVEAVRPLLEAASQRFELELPGHALYLDADLTRLTQVLLNLLHNAVKYTEPGGRISLVAKLEDGRAVVRIRDDGVGIPPEMLGRIFDMFTQVDRSLERSQGGLGIGLSLVKRLVEMHGGSVEAHSEGLGRGSEFVVRLPSIAPRETRGAKTSGRSDGLGRSPLCRILVVDDNTDAALTLGAMLELQGHEVRTAYDGLAALEIAASFQPDVALLDIGLPGMNGRETARRIRSQPWGREMLLVAVTGWGQGEDKKRSIEAGFDLHMVKPIDHSALEGLLAGFGRGSTRGSGG
jgi:PAS domain S-box-containing protein